MPLKGAVSAQKALQGSETESRELLGGKKETLNKGSLICPLGTPMILHKKEKETRTIGSAARPELGLQELWVEAAVEGLSEVLLLDHRHVAHALC